MSDTTQNNPSQNPEELEQNQETQGTQNQPEPTQTQDEPKPKAEAKPEKKLENPTKFWKTQAKEKDSYIEEMKAKMEEFEKTLENERLTRRKSEAMAKALELGLNPQRRATFEKLALDAVANSEDYEASLNQFKQDLPELFKEPVKNFTGNVPSGGGGNDGLSNAEVEKILASGNNVLFQKHQKDIARYFAQNTK